MKFAVVFLLVLAKFSAVKTIQKPPTYTVTLEYFSGRPSPVWTIESGADEYKEFSTMFIAAKRSKGLFDVDDTPSKLGYRGFIVCDQSSESLILGKDTADLQKLLLETAPRGLLSDKIVKKVTAGIDRGVSPTTKGRTRRAAPAWPPRQIWNDVRVRKCNNCYNYALDMTLPPKKRFGVPGLAGNQPYWVPVNQITNAGMLAAAVRDKLVQVAVGPGNAIPVIPANQAQSRHLVALVVDPDTAPGADDGDFHWYRLDNNGRWSHKPGSTPHTNRDGNNAVIADPRNAANDPFGPQYNFVSFMTVVNGVTKVKGMDDDSC